MVKVIALAALLLLSGCSQAVEVACISPGAQDQFIMRDVGKVIRDGNTLVMETSPQEAIYYYVPQGSACRVGPARTLQQQENTLDQRNERDDQSGNDLHGNLHADAEGPWPSTQLGAVYAADR